MQKRDIKTIDFGKAVRLRIGMYLSANPAEALHLALREIYVNSLDALQEIGAKDGRILINIDSKKETIEVIDNGPGIPNAIREDGSHSLIAAFTMPHTGSHFDNRETNAIGLNGIGASVVTHTSKRFKVISNDGESCYYAEFESDEDGAHIVSQGENPIGRLTGVSVKYSPDKAIYEDNWFVEEELRNELSEMMKFYPKIRIELNFDGRRSTITYPNGLKEKNTKIYYESKNLILSLSLEKGEIKPFGNRLYLPQGGAFITHFKTQLTRNINSLTGLKLSGLQIQSMFSGYVAIFVSNPLFSNQSKTEIGNKEVNSEITIAIKDGIDDLVKAPEWRELVKSLEAEMKAAEAAERARQKILKSMDEINKGSKKRVRIGDKFKDCQEHGEDSFLALCEGSSAVGALVWGRDVKNTALFELRGKIINCLKSKKDKYLSNVEIQQIAQILGAGIFESYNSKKLRFGKVLIATDADADGRAIMCLITTFFYVCMPDFLKEGRLWWMQSPLYYDEKGNFAFEEEEKKNLVKPITRAKGLGELEEKAAAEALFGKSKRWIQLKPSNWEKFEEAINSLMGPQVAGRKEFLFNEVDFERVIFM
ncbi:toprim domain-containing protein [Massilibacteroides sp.]|uniref:toprim domain-containing protein n=1 Tax=Massilibacteroides sp. TaxID=2034766 RepID=UPI00261E3609|nr:toprim domain-containing protein [Massilibacteroides sp.]MDD4516349.1 ATP-binding protein [Massilibacteroides sp.]